MTSVIKKLSVSTLKVSEVMTKNVFCLSSETTVKDAIRIFVANKISGAPLILPATKILLSVVSEADLIKFAAMDGLDHQIKVYLDKLPKLEDMVTARSYDSFGELFKKFLLKPVRRVIVVSDDGHVVGIVSRRDIMSAFVKESEKT
jgi:predicted transcriptional regulator